MIFITGANGLVGSFILRKLLAEGNKIRAIKRPGANLTLINDIADQVEWVEGDILDIPLMEKSLQDISTVIHSAAIISFDPSQKDLMMKTNVEGTSVLVNASLKNNVSKFCFISSIAAIGRKKEQIEITESSVWENSPMNSEYAKSKYLSELEVWRGFEEGLNGFIVNPSVVLGPGDWNRGSSKLFRYVWNENLFYSESEMNFIDVRDVADIVSELLKKEIKNQRFILNAGVISYKSLFGLIATAMNKRVPPFKVNRLVAELAWRTEFLRSLISGKEPLITRETAGIARRTFRYKNDKIKNMLNYNFRELSDTISWTCGELIGRNVKK
ncbi:MAG: NAD-dependent epimerase/dehydratase family protein [Cytophagaceae bacterium]